jgi:P-type Cu2+ transporter
MDHSDAQESVSHLDSAVAGAKCDAVTDCIHCGLPLNKNQRPQDGPFCCSGCKTVYELIHNEGLERYYDLRRNATLPPAELRANTFGWLAPEWDAATPLPGDDNDVRRLQLDLQGVHCAACVWLLEELFERHAGGRLIRINPALGTVELIWDATASDLVIYLAEVEPFGYRFGPARRGTTRRSRGLLIRLGICVAAAMNVMGFSFSYYLGLSPEDGMIYGLFGRLTFGLATLALLVGGWPFVSTTWRGIRRRVVHLDLPIALGMVLTYAGSTYAYFASGPEAAYFDTITIFIALMLVGRWLQEHVLERNRNSLLTSGGVGDLYTRRIESGVMNTIAASDITVGDILWIATGDLVPVSGVLMFQSATVSLDWITGEADAKAIGPGQEIPAGAFNASESGFRLTATEDFSGSRLNDLLRSDGAKSETAASAADSSSLRAGWWNNVARIYVQIVLTLAALGFGLWISHGVQKAVEVSVAILVITCPCALGLAVPLGRELVHVTLRRAGVMLRSESFLDRALQIKQIIFDKTGTVTRGQVGLTSLSYNAVYTLAPEKLTLLWNMVHRSNHPLSVCLSEACRSVARQKKLDLSLDPQGDAVQEISGQGLSWQYDDTEFKLGKPDFALFDSIDTNAAGENSENTEVARVVFSENGASLGQFEFSEELRGDTASEVDQLQSLGFHVFLLSGDRQSKVAKVADQLGIPASRAEGDLSPEAKAAVVTELDHEDTLMVGDGINDSLSFDAAYCAGTPAVDRAIMPQKADFYFLGDGIKAVRYALMTARRLRRVQRDNLILAAVYNLIAVTICMMGHVSPVVAAILMPLSSVAIVGMTAGRLGGRKPKWMS